jgi:hypothetical protein
MSELEDISNKAYGHIRSNCIIPLACLALMLSALMQIQIHIHSHEMLDSILDTFIMEILCYQIIYRCAHGIVQRNSEFVTNDILVLSIVVSYR